MATLNPKNLKFVREARRFSIYELAKATGISNKYLEDLESGARTKVSSDKLSKIAVTLGTSSIALNWNNFPNLEPLPKDFRRKILSSMRISHSGMSHFQWIKDQISFLKEFQSEHLEFEHSGSLKLSNSAAEAAGLWRKNFDLTAENQTKWNPSELFRWLTGKIEEQNIFVFTRSTNSDDYRGFFHEIDGIQTICVNTKNLSKQSQIFTLLHEFAHALLDEEGISDPFTTNNKTERFCNRFAANFLAPTDLVNLLKPEIFRRHNDPIDHIKALASKLNLSLYASAIRLDETSTNQTGYVASYKGFFKDKNLDFERNTGGGPTTEYDYGRNYIAKFSAKLISTTARAIQAESLETIDALSQFKVREEHFISLVQNALNREFEATGTPRSIKIRSLEKAGEEFDVRAG